MRQYNHDAGEGNYSDRCFIGNTISLPLLQSGGLIPSSVSLLHQCVNPKPLLTLQTHHGSLCSHQQHPHRAGGRSLTAGDASSRVCVLSAGLSLSTSDRLFRLTELSPFLHSLLALGSGGLLAFGLSFSEFLLVSCTSSLTLSIAGIFKVTFLFNLLVRGSSQFQ